MRDPVCGVAATCVRDPACAPFCAGLESPTQLLPPPVAVKLCLFRTCRWQSENITTAPVDVQEEVIARHLLAAHEEELRTLGRFAEEMCLL